MDTAGPLAGTVVLDLSRVLSGPYCTMMLRDLGALVIKVETPDGGDEARQFLPMLPPGGSPVEHAGDAQQAPEERRSGYFAAINRGKKSIALDLRAAADRVVFDQLLSRADVLVENFRPGVMDKLGLAPSLLRAKHARLVIASISGFGQSGPYRHRAAYDVVVQAMSGLMSVTGQPGGPPTRCGTSIGDLAAALFACNGIQAALLQRARTGAGSHVDVAMLEAQVALLEGAIPQWFASGVSPQPLGARHPGTAPFDAFRAADAHLVIAAGSDHLFRALTDVLSCPEWLADPRFADRQSRVRHQAALKDLIESVLMRADVAHWLARLEAAGVPAGPINDVAAMAADPQIQHRGVLAPIANGEGQRAAVTPIRFDEQPYPQRLPAVPRLDEHRAEILHFARGGTPAGWP